MSSSVDPGALGAFLRARRQGLTPEEVGLPSGPGHRRVTGLRRTEAAQLANISIEYYTRLEQGRVRASATVLASLVRALRLDDDAQRYVYELAGRADGQTRRRSVREAPRPAIRRLLDRLEGTPAIVLARRLNIVGWNDAAAALYLDFGALPVKERNYLRLMFLHPGFRALHREWEHDARTAVGAVRLEAAGDLHDSALAELVGELSLRDDDFRAWWAQQQLSGRYQGVKHYRHPLVGELALDCDTWNSPDGSGQRLMVLTAEPGTPSADALRILTAWQEPGEAYRPEQHSAR
ncbi:helix-turn-helix domain-containing protein [Dactylosporangium salmoneum]|uniref:Helix-turn-helix domain-containing protein n=1 Tax=Dactylosporangium salmoneum TaxID=53361 RepID=A0ABN3G0U6_9ACTN